MAKSELIKKLTKLIQDNQEFDTILISFILNGNSTKTRFLSLNNEEG